MKDNYLPKDLISSLKLLLERPRYTHKSACGRVAIIAGSHSMPGAGVLTCLASLRAGAGVVYYLGPEEVFPHVTIQYPEIIGVPTTHDLKGCDAAKSFINNKNIDAIAIGPGLGTDMATQAFVHEMIRFGMGQGLPTVLDADALNCLNENELTSMKTPNVPASMVLTPHLGEWKRFFKSSAVPTADEKLPVSNDDALLKCDGWPTAHHVLSAANRLNQIVLLKGPHTVVSNGKDTYINKTGNPGMATAGSGDVLTGIILALMGQGLPPYDATVLGVYIHGRSGDLVFNKKDIGLIATDIVNYIPSVCIELREAYGLLPK